MASSSQHRAQPPSTTTLYASSPYSPPSPPPGPPATSSGADDSLYAAYPYRSSFLDDDPPPARTLYASYPFPPGTKKPTPTRTARSPFHHHHQQQQQPDFANMTEVAFAKQFLAALDARPVKLSADHVEDPRSYPARSAYILPRPPKPMSKPAAGGSSASAGPAPPGSEPSYTVTVKSLRNPPLDLRLTSQTANTAVLDVKDAVVARTHIPADKIKMLFAKKPVLDSKVLKDLAAPGGATTLDFTVMILGGAATAAEATAKAAAAAGQGEAPKDAAGTFQADVVAQGPSGPEVLQSTEFWDDLKGYLLQRIRDEKEANDVFDTFQTAWKNKT